MNNLLSAVSGLFPRSYLVGTLLPAALFMVASMLFVVPLYPVEGDLLNPLAQLGTGWQIVFFTFLTLLMSGLLYSVNSPIIRLYEGYPWKGSWLGQKLIVSYEAKHEAARARRSGIRPLLRHAQQDIGTEEYDKMYGYWSQLGEELNFGLPYESDSILPTRLGNVICSFEDYPYHEYGIDAVELWPRLWAVVDQTYAATVSDAKALFDFMLNNSFLSFLLMLATVAGGLIYPARVDSSFWWLGEIFAFSSVAYLAYLGCINRALAWGGTVRGAFDLYRQDLLNQLGFTIGPLSRHEERELWEGISRQMTYGDHPTQRPPQYTVPPSYAEGEPSIVDLTVTRAVNRVSVPGLLRVTLSVKNEDPRRKVVRNAIVTDMLPEGYCYRWGSARLERKHSHRERVLIEGANPYKFVIGTLAPGDEVTLTFAALAPSGERQELWYGPSRNTWVNQ